MDNMIKIQIICFLIGMLCRPGNGSQTTTMSVYFCDTHNCIHGGTCREIQEDCACTVGFHDYSQCEYSAMMDVGGQTGLIQQVINLQSQSNVRASEMEDIIDEGQDIFIDHIDKDYSQTSSTMAELVTQIMTPLIDLASKNFDKTRDATSFIQKIIILAERIMLKMEEFGSNNQCSDYDTTTIFNTLLTGTGSGLLNILKVVGEETELLSNFQKITQFTTSILDYLNRTSCVTATAPQCCVNQTNALLHVLNETAVGIINTTEAVAGTCSNNLDVTQISEEVFRFVVSGIDLMKDTVCSSGNGTSGNGTSSECKMMLSEARSVMVEVESILKSMSKLALDRGCADMATQKLITVDYISVAVLSATGDNLPDVISTAFTSLQMPFWETFQLTYKDTLMVVYVISYEDTSISFAANSNDKDSAFIKSNVVESATGNELTLLDEEDTTEVHVGANDAFDGFWDKMKIHNKTLGTFTCIGQPKADSTDLLLEIQFDSTGTCTTLGLYGTLIPEEDLYEFLIETDNNGVVREMVTPNLVYTFEDQILKLAIKKDIHASSLQPLVVRTQCRESTPTTQHNCRVAVMNLRVFNQTSQMWMEDHSLKFYKSEFGRIKFKSSFFGTMSANVFFIPPETIDLSTFGRFDELLNQPYGLSTIIALLTAFILLAIPLRRLDKKDSIMWNYLPLVDNPLKGRFAYYVSIYTDILSAKKMGAVPYFEVKGKNGKSGVRILCHNERQNFGSGTCSNFLMKTEFDLGDLREIKIWHDGTGKSPRWLLNRITISRAVTNVRYVFMCNQWLSLACEDGKTWRRLKVSKSKDRAMSGSFNDSAKRRLFDDHLWLSVFKRPRFSRFSRAQRLWTLAALLFLTMLTSAMWYSSENEATGRTLSLGPIKLSYKQFYVGIMSSGICFLPCMIIVSIFANRRFRQNKQSPLKKIIRGNSCLFPWWFIFIAYFLILCCIGASVTFIMAYFVQWGKEKVLEWLLSFFIGAIEDILILQPIKVLLLAAVITTLCNGLQEADVKLTAPPDFTRDFALESSNNVSLSDLETFSATMAKFVKSDYHKMAKLLGFKDNEIVEWDLQRKYKSDRERAKAVIIHWLFKNMITSCVFTEQQLIKLISVMQELNKQDAVEWLFSHVGSQNYFITSDEQRNRFYPCPTENEEGHLIDLRKRLQLDHRLFTHMMNMVIRCAYVGFLILLCTHNTIPLSYLQNEQLIASVNGTGFRPNLTDDVYFWIKNYFIPAAFPVLWAPDTLMVRRSYDQLFMYNAYSKRLGLARLRQVRVKEGCYAIGDLLRVANFCTVGYSDHHEDKETYCKGWQSYEETCDSAEEYAKEAFKYSGETQTKAIPYLGTIDVYNAGGYTVDIGPKQSQALDMIQTLESHNWLDVYTRALFVEMISFNANTLLFSHLKIVFEQTCTGGWFIKPEAWSSNLYPYTETRDYIILAAQLVFIVLTIIQIFAFLIGGMKLGSKCCFTLNMWIKAFEILLSVSAIVMYILRIVYTIDAVEKMFNEYEEETFVPFDLVYIFDQIYILCLSVILFIAILDMLKPLTFNYYLHLMRTSIAISGGHIASYILMITVPIFSFACLMYLLVGSNVADFKNIQTSFMTMWVLLLNMFKFGNSIEMDSLLIKFIFGSFTFIMSIVLVNVFVSILNESFGEVKHINTEDNSKYDKDLNEHFWRKLEDIFMKLGKNRHPRGIIPDARRMNQLSIPDEKFEILNKLVSTSDKHLKLFDKVVTIHTCRPQSSITDWNAFYKRPMTATLKQQSGTDEFIYTERLDSLEIYICVCHCSERRRVSYSCHKLISAGIVDANSSSSEKWKTVYEFKPVESPLQGQVVMMLFDHSSCEHFSHITVSFDSLKSTETYMGSATPIREGKYGTKVVLRRVPTHLVIQNMTRNDGFDYSTVDIFQMVTVSEGGCIIRSVGLGNTTVTLKVLPNAVRRTCNAYIRIQPSSSSILLHIISPCEDVILPTEVKVPRTGSLIYNGKEKQFSLLIKEEDSVWKEQHNDVECDKGFFWFKLPYLKKCVKTSVLVKEFEITEDNLRENLSRTLPDGIINIIVENVVREVNNSKDLLIHLKIGSLKIQKWQHQCRFRQKHTVTSLLLKQWILQSTDQISAIKTLGDVAEKLEHSHLSQWILQTCSELEQKETEIWKMFKKICELRNDSLTRENLAYELGIYDVLLKDTSQSLPRSQEEHRFHVLVKWYGRNQTVPLDNIKVYLKGKIPELRDLDL